MTMIEFKKKKKKIQFYFSRWSRTPALYTSSTNHTFRSAFPASEYGFRKDVYTSYTSIVLGANPFFFLHLLIGVYHFFLFFFYFLLANEKFYKLKIYIIVFAHLFRVRFYLNCVLVISSLYFCLFVSCILSYL